jgi:hypothetical protein
MPFEDYRDSAGIAGLIILSIIIASCLAFGFMLGVFIESRSSQPFIDSCTTITPVCQDSSAYYISYPDSNYAISCPVKPEVRIKDIDIKGWE